MKFIFFPLLHFTPEYHIYIYWQRSMALNMAYKEPQVCVQNLSTSLENSETLNNYKIKLKKLLIWRFWETFIILITLIRNRFFRFLLATGNLLAFDSYSVWKSKLHILCSNSWPKGSFLNDYSLLLGSCQNISRGSPSIKIP